VKWKFSRVTCLVSPALVNTWVVTYLIIDSPLLYGMPYAGVVPVAPDLSAPEYQWPSEAMATLSSMPEPCINPAPSEEPPANTYYPLAQTYHLETTSAYKHGCVYACDFDTSTREELYKKMLQVQTPPGSAPIISGNTITCNPIPGMIRIPAGVPFINYIDGDRTKPITVAVLHTLESMDAYPEGPDVRRWSNELRSLIWGNPKTQSQEECRPFYAANLKPNLRAGKTTAQTAQGYNGSFSLAITKGEGEGTGVGLPALQHASPKEQEQIAEILRLVHKLYRAIAPCALSRFEMEMIDFNSNDNNVFCFGGLAPNNTGCQANVSSGLGELWKIIGRLQGAWHTDINDCIYRWTFLIFLFRLAPGKDGYCYWTTETDFLMSNR
jgi:hypothetical protein